MPGLTLKLTGIISCAVLGKAANLLKQLHISDATHCVHALTVPAMLSHHASQLAACQAHHNRQDILRHLNTSHAVEPIAHWVFLDILLMLMFITYGRQDWREPANRQSVLLADRSL